MNQAVTHAGDLVKDRPVVGVATATRKATSVASASYCLISLPTASCLSFLAAPEETNVAHQAGYTRGLPRIWDAIPNRDGCRIDRLDGVEERDDSITGMKAQFVNEPRYPFAKGGLDGSRAA